MTVTTTLDRQYANGDGNNKNFPFNFRFFQNSDVYVFLIGVDGIPVMKTLNVDYTLSGANQSGGGTVVFAVAPPAGTQNVFIQRVLAQTQPTSIRNQGAFFPAIHEDVFDRLTMLIQQAIAGLGNALQLTYSKSGFDFKGFKGINLGDGSADSDAVNVRGLRSYVESAVAGVIGGYGWFLQSGVGAIQRTFQEKMRESFSVKDFGAKGDGVTDDSSAINRAASALKAIGGGILKYPKGVYAITSPIIVDSFVYHTGEGFGVTTVSVLPGSNCDAFLGRDFDILTGVGPITSAPVACGIVDMTIQCNYLDLGPTWKEISWRDSDVVLNSRGSGVRVFATRFEARLEIFNVADNALYIEAIGGQFDNSTAGARIWIDGRISGQEGVIIRGPGDSGIDLIAFGLCGVLPVSQRAATASLISRIYPAEQVHGLVIDNAGVYEGHCEITRAHLYGVSFGFGIKTLGVCRLNALHLATDNCRGGFGFSEATHGLVSVGEARGNGRQPTGYTGSAISAYPDMQLANGNIWSLEIHLKSARYAPSENDPSGYAVQVSGSNNIVAITRQGQTQSDGLPIQSRFLSVTGDNNTIEFTCKRQRGHVLYLAGNNNNIRGTCSQIYEGTVLARDTTGAKACFNNIVDITANELQASSTLFNSIGISASENIRLLGSGSSGYTSFAGTAPAIRNRSSDWSVSALIGSSVDGKTTNDYLDIAVPALAVSGTFTVPHNFLYAPDALQVGISIRYPGTPANQNLTLGLVSSTSSDLTLSYRWTAIPTSGSATAVIHIK